LSRRFLFGLIGGKRKICVNQKNRANESDQDRPADFHDHASVSLSFRMHTIRTIRPLIQHVWIYRSLGTLAFSGSLMFLWLINGAEIANINRSAIRQAIAAENRIR
jgi:hypothetical protein